jgi:hypothetical protein
MVQFCFDPSHRGCNAFLTVAIIHIAAFCFLAPFYPAICCA